jgi:hypothetical protein
LPDVARKENVMTMKTMTPIPTFAMLAGLLTERGFEPGVPPWLSPRALAADRNALLGMKCGRCRRRGLEYRPYFRDIDRRYSAVCVCPGCHSAEEF